MVIERNSEEIIIRLPATVDIADLQDFIDFERYKEITAKFKVDQIKVDQLAKEVNKNWWSANRVQAAALAKSLAIRAKTLHFIAVIFSKQRFISIERNY